MHSFYHVDLHAAKSGKGICASSCRHFHLSEEADERNNIVASIHLWLTSGA
jgi:hypothetical protein